MVIDSGMTTLARQLRAAQESLENGWAALNAAGAVVEPLPAVATAAAETAQSVRSALAEASSTVPSSVRRQAEHAASMLDSAARHALDRSEPDGLGHYMQWGSTALSQAVRGLLHP